MCIFLIPGLIPCLVKFLGQSNLQKSATQGKEKYMYAELHVISDSSICSLLNNPSSIKNLSNSIFTIN